MDDVYENIDEYNPNRKRNILIDFDDMIAYTILSHNQRTVAEIRELDAENQILTRVHHLILLWC